MTLDEFREYQQREYPNFSFDECLKMDKTDAQHLVGPSGNDNVVITPLRKTTLADFEELHGKGKPTRRWPTLTQQISNER